METQTKVKDQAAAAPAPSACYSENFNRADFANEEEMCDVVESFEQLHRSIPWLAKAGVSSECHRGQLQILQAAIDYIIDLEEQLTDQLTGDFYRAAALAAASAAVRRPFADVNCAAASCPEPIRQASPLLSSSILPAQTQTLSAQISLSEGLSEDYSRKSH